MTSRISSLVLFLSVAGCGGLQVHTWSSTDSGQQTDPSSETASADAATTESAATKTPPADDSPEDLGEVALGDLQRPISRTYKGMRDRTIKLTSPTRRTIRIFSLHGVLYRVRPKEGENAENWESKEIVVDKEVELELNTRSNGVERYPDEEYGIVIYDPKVTGFTTQDVFALPPVDGPIARRALEDHAPWWDRSHFPRNDTPTSDAAAWLEAVDQRFFMFTTATRCNLLEDEPVVVLRYTETSRGYEVTVLRANGEEVTCREQEDESPLFTSSRPAKIALPAPAKARVRPLPTIWSEEPFLEDVSTRPDIAKYVANKQKTRECSDRTWDRLDPDSRAGRYDVVTRDASGRIVGAESLSDRIGRQVDAACNMNALWTEREKLFEKWHADHEVRSKAMIASVGKRFGATH